MHTLTPSAVRPAPTFQSLYGLLPDPGGTATAAAVPPDDVPEPYRSLLVHTHHMTVTVERFYGRPVDVRVIQSRLDGDEYSRKILLTLQGTGQVVQFGVVRIDLGVLAPAVRDQIIAGRTPLGRVLIQNDVLRRIEPAGYLRVTPHRTMCEWFGLAEAVPTFGRLGVIHTDGRPAIEVLEVLAPVGRGESANPDGR